MTFETDNLTFTEAFETVHNLLKQVGFDSCTFVSTEHFEERLVIHSSCPAEWVADYRATGVGIDPFIDRARHTLLPVLWTDDLPLQAVEFREQSKVFGLCYGWSQGAYCDGMFSVLSVSRREPLISIQELYKKAAYITWLCNTLHMAHLKAEHRSSEDLHLSPRELDILRWSAMGKTAEEVSIILKLAQSTIHFHLRNAISKLGVLNKTAAVARAARAGLL